MIVAIQENEKTWRKRNLPIAFSVSMLLVSGLLRSVIGRSISLQRNNRTLIFIEKGTCMYNDF
jgi:hypothetical protein